MNSSHMVLKLNEVREPCKDSYNLRKIFSIKHIELSREIQQVTNLLVTKLLKFTGL